MLKAGDLVCDLYALIERRYAERVAEDAGGERHVWIDASREWAREVTTDERLRREREVGCPHCHDEGVTPLTYDGYPVRALCDCGAANKWHDAKGGSIVVGYWSIQSGPQTENSTTSAQTTAITQVLEARIAQDSPVPRQVAFTDAEALREAREAQEALEEQRLIDEGNAALDEIESDGEDPGASYRDSEQQEMSF